ncbi:UNVERIFIED_CONTAM: hypothetical protein GTU68_021673 [Idotea baltica]|nr:hypothetical protein [Idotea baltica]
MKKVTDLGVDPSRIIYAHPCKPASHLRQAVSLGVDLMTFDNETELSKVKDLMPSAKLVIRIRCDAAKAQCPLGEKFGVDPDLALPLLRSAKEKGLNVVGVSFHVGSGCQEPEVFLRAIKASREVFDEAVNLGFSPYLLDIGGGFPGISGTSLNEAAKYINLALDQHFPEQEIQVIAEPGRYVVASAFTLVTQVISKRRVAPHPSFMYYINDGIYGSMNCVLYDHQAVFPEVLDLDPPNSNEERPDPPLYRCSIWGPTCDSLDQVVQEAHLKEVDVGDWIVFRDMGAYTISAAGTFNGFPVPLVHVVIPFHTW